MGILRLEMRFVVGTRGGLFQLASGLSAALAEAWAGSGV